MRVLLVVDIGWLAGGAERSVVVLRDELRRRGHEVRVVGTDKNATGKDVFADVVVPHIGGSAVMRLLRFAFYRRAYKMMRQEIRTFQPDVVHFHTVGEFSPSVLFAARHTPYVMTVHGPEDFTLDLLPWHLPSSDYREHSYRQADLRLVGRLRTGYLRFLQRPIYLLALRRCRALIAPSKFMARVLTEDVSVDRIVQIYNGIDLPRSALLLEPRTLLYAGRLEEVKGVDTLVKAFAAAHKDQPDARLHVVGDGSARDRMQSLVDSLQLGGVVTFHGWLPATEVRLRLEASTALVLPSVWPENLPTVVIEAMAVGRPVIGTTVGGIPELVGDGQSGVVVAPYDVDGLADAMRSVLVNLPHARQMAVAARHKSADFSVELFTARTEALYDRMLAA